MKKFSAHIVDLNPGFFPEEAAYLHKMADDYIRLLDDTALTTQGRVTAEELYKKKWLIPAREILREYPITKSNKDMLDACIYIDFYQKTIWDPMGTSTDKYWIQFNIRRERNLMDDISYNTDVTILLLD